MMMYKKGFLIVLGLIVATSVALAYVEGKNGALRRRGAAAVKSGDGIVGVNLALVQDKVLMGADGRVGLALTLDAGEPIARGELPAQPVDLVVVLDRSGSMGGQKISDARNAVIQLMNLLTPEDRLALVTYANDVHNVSGLIAMDDFNRHRMMAWIGEVYAGGGTNLGGGLHSGIQMLLQAPASGRQRKVILISDGLANQGITDPLMLGNMAAKAVSHHFSISTVGVGYDFNEVLMTTIADHGTGRYYFLENPQAFAQVFAQACQNARHVVAGALEIRVPLRDGVRLIHAGGYPIETDNGKAVIHPGDLLSGQQRKLFLTFKVPTDRQRDFSLGGIQVRYQHEGETMAFKSEGLLSVACIADRSAVTASIDEAAWSEQVVQEDFGKLKEEVAEAIRRGEKERAINRIRDYEAGKRELNAIVGSAQVAENLEKDVQSLRQSVEDTFVGAPAQVAAKRKQSAKALQYESYQIRRDKK